MQIAKTDCGICFDSDGADLRKDCGWKYAAEEDSFGRSVFQTRSNEQSKKKRGKIMNYQEVINEAKTCMGAYCKVCPVCNGRACKNQMPGPGAKGVGDTAIRNYEKWQEIRVNMDTICENKPVDTSLELFGKTFRFPFFAGPVGAVQLHYGKKYDDMTYNEVLVKSVQRGRNCGIHRRWYESGCDGGSRQSDRKGGRCRHSNGKAVEYRDNP